MTRQIPKGYKLVGYYRPKDRGNDYVHETDERKVPKGMRRVYREPEKEEEKP